jgi:hypothetical protein
VYERLADAEKAAGYIEPQEASPEEKEAEADAQALRALRAKQRRIKVKREAEKIKLQKVKDVIKKMQALQVDVSAGKGEAFRLWKRLVIEFERKRRTRQEQERQERLLLLGEDWAKFTIPYDVTNKRQVELSIQINKFTSPSYFKITIENMDNTVKQDDTVIMKALRMPGTLKNTEKDPKKIKHVFLEKLKVVWQPLSEQVDGIPRMLDAFFDNTVIKE